jgi:hypothetical protein
MLKRFKYWKSPCVLVEESKIKRSKLVATLSGNAIHDHNAPAPNTPKAVLLASVPSPVIGINSIKSHAYIFYFPYEMGIYIIEQERSGARCS